MQQSSICRIALIRCFYRFIVNSLFASAAFFAPVIPSCIRYPAIPVCKKCAKMCRAKISPLNRHRIFMQSRENGRVRAQNGSCNLACSDQASNVHQQLRFMAGIWTIEQTPPYYIAGTLWKHGVPAPFVLSRIQRINKSFKIFMQFITR